MACPIMFAAAPGVNAESDGTVRKRTDAPARRAQSGHEVRGQATSEPNEVGPLRSSERNGTMNRIIWLVGAIVIILFVLGYFGLR